jgi:2-C-methyl-D-erythritol 4-phosphate cytidylyltransferase
MRTTVLLVAAGSGSRLRAGVPKAMAPLGDGRTMVEHCLDSLAAAAAPGHHPALRLNAIAVVVPADPEAAAALTEVCAAFSQRTSIPVRTVPGGAERADSVRAGLAAVRELADAGATAGPFGRHAVLVHDAARPFVPPAVFHAVVAALEAGETAVVPAIPVVDTIKTVAPAPHDSETGTGDAVPEHVTGTPSRAHLRAVQTPQGFDLTSLEAAHRHAAEVAADSGTDAAALTDDAMAMEAAGHVVAVVPGDPLAFKITTPLDLVLANALLLPAPGPGSPSTSSTATTTNRERP